MNPVEKKVEAVRMMAVALMNEIMALNSEHGVNMAEDIREYIEQRIVEEKL